MCHKYDLNKYVLIDQDINYMTRSINDQRVYTEAENATASAVYEFIQWRDDCTTSSHTKHDLVDIIEYISTM